MYINFGFYNRTKQNLYHNFPAIRQNQKISIIVNKIFANLFYHQTFLLSLSVHADFIL